MLVFPGRRHKFNRTKKGNLIKYGKVSINMSFDMPMDSKTKMLNEIEAKLDDISKNIETIREFYDEQSYLLMLILAVHATNAGLVKPHEYLATDIKEILASRRIIVEVTSSESSKDPQ